LLEWWQKIPLSLLKGYEGWVRSAIYSLGGDRIVMASGDEAAYWSGIIRYLLLYAEDSRLCVHAEDDNPEVEYGSVQLDLC